MLPKKVLDLRKFAGLPKYLVFSNEDKILKPYSSWDIINRSRWLVETNMYRRYDVVFSSLKVRDRCLKAIWDFQCVIAHNTLPTASCAVHMFDVVEPDTFLDCCKAAAESDKEYVLVIHEVSSTYMINSVSGTIEFGYLSDALTYDRR